MTDREPMSKKNRSPGRIWEVVFIGGPRTGELKSFPEQPPYDFISVHRVSVEQSRILPARFDLYRLTKLEQNGTVYIAYMFVGLLNERNELIK